MSLEFRLQAVRLAPLLPPPTPVSGAVPRAQHHPMMHALQFSAVVHFIRSH